MDTDLTKMVEEWENVTYLFARVLKAMAAEIKVNREEIEKLKGVKG